ncbi:UNVERIFIED_CONTAM: hypothetical protein FKN15_039493 [Acipenser sinensis]
MEEAPAERPKGREEPTRAKEALREDPLPVTQGTPEAGPDFTTEGPAAAGVVEGAQEGPPTEQLPRAPPSSGSDTGPETCVAEEGAAEPAPEAGVGSADNAEPIQATSAEGPEGEEEPPQEQEPPRAPEASVVSADIAEPMQATPAEGPEGGKEPPQEQEPPRAPEASMGSADNAEPMQAAPVEGSEGGEEAPQPEQELPQASLSCSDGGSGPRAAAEGEEETPPQADAGSAEPALTLVSGARKGGEEPERAEGGALKADPLPEVQRGQETGPQGPVPVTEGAREEPLKQLLPRASLSGGGEGSGPYAAVGGETEAVPMTDAELGEGPERVYPLSLGEGGEGPERVDPHPSRAEGGPETVPRTSKEGPRAGKTRPSGSAAYVERPSAPPKSRVQTVPARVPPRPLGGGAGGVGENPNQTQRAHPPTAPGEKAAEWTVVARHKKAAAARSTGAAKQGATKPADAPSGGGSGTPSTAPPVRQGGKATRKTKHLIPTEGEERRAAGELPVAVTGQGTESGGLRGKRKAQARLPTYARKCTRTGLLVWGPGMAKEGPTKPKRPPRRPPFAGNEGPGPRATTEGGKDPPPERVWGSADNAEPMQATPAEGPEGGKEPPQEQELPLAPEASVGSADNAEPMRAAPPGGSEGGEEPPHPEQELPQTSLSCGDRGSGPRAAPEGDEETPPEADAGSAEPTLVLVSGARKGGEEPEMAEGGALKVDPLPDVQRGQETGPQPSIEGPVPVTEGAREEPLKEPPPRASLSGGDKGSGRRGGEHRPRRSR